MKKFLLFLLLSICSVLNAQVPQLWGAMSLGGTMGIGGIFKINGDGTGYNLVYNCQGGTQGGSIQSTLIPQGNTIYGNSVSGGNKSIGDIFRYDVATNTYNMLYSLDTLSGFYPRGKMIKATNGLYYGLNSVGGTSNKGTIFSFDPVNNQYIKCYDFNSASGQLPNGSFLEASNGKLYGMTTSGGTMNQGVIFTYDPSNNQHTIVHNFDFFTGFAPYGSLIEGANGLLYGVAFGGGSMGYGVLFSFNTSNNQILVLHNFDGVNGSAPYGTLLEVNGVLYGTTSQGGMNAYGVIFSYNPTANTFNKLHDFDDATGRSPFGNVMIASDGNFYGLTINGGTNGLGAIYRLEPGSNTYTKLYDGNIATGGLPYADLIEYSGSTGISEMNKDLSAEVYPNPAETEFTIELSRNVKNSHLILNDVQGRNVYAIKLSDFKTNVSCNLQSGIYFYTITSEEGTVSGKVVIK